MKSISWMQFGVDIFFVISGFVMVVSTRDRKIAPTTFMFRRLIRIAPLYWLLTFFIAKATPSWTWLSLMMSLFFIPSINAINGKMEPVLNPGWTLNFEMYFYALFAMALILPARWRLASVSGALLLVQLSFMVYPLGPVHGFYARSMVMSFAFGMAIATFDVRLPGFAALVGLALLIGLADASAPRWLAQGIPAALIVAGARSINNGATVHPAIVLLGNASYAIYLAHLPAIVIAGDALHTTLTPGFFALIVLAAVGLAAGLVVHLAIERPIMRDIHRIIALRTGISNPS